MGALGSLENVEGSRRSRQNTDDSLGFEAENWHDDSTHNYAG